MNKRMQDIIRQLMGTGSAVSGCTPSTVAIFKKDRLKLQAVEELVALGVVVQVGTRCDGDLLVFGSAWAHFYGDRQEEKRAGLDDEPARLTTAGQGDEAADRFA